MAERAKLGKSLVKWGDVQMLMHHILGLASQTYALALGLNYGFRSPMIYFMGKRNTNNKYVNFVFLS